MNIVIVGGGKVGYYLVKTLMENDHDVSLIEANKDTCKFLANNLDIPIICGDGTYMEVLENSQIQDADALISVTGQDETNLISCQLAKKIYNVKKTIAKVNNPKNTTVMQKLGIDITVSSTETISKLLEREITSSTIREVISLDNGDMCICEIKIPNDSKLDGKKLSEIRLPEECIIISIIRKGKHIIPRGHIKVMSKDVIMIMAHSKLFPQIKNILKLN